jgi:hypothetical protein
MNFLENRAGNVFSRSAARNGAVMGLVKYAAMKIVRIAAVK